MARRIEDVHVVVVGSVNFDLVVKADRLPQEGESLLVHDLRFFHGGKGANQAVGVARLGARASLLSAVGKDVVGDFLVEGLRANAIDAAGVKRDPERASGCAFIMLFPNGNNCIIVEPSANLAITPADLERAREVIERADALITNFEVPLEVVETALRLARRAGKLAVLDAGPPRHWSPEVLKLADIVSPNETELAHLSRLEVSGRDSALEAAKSLLAAGVQTLALKLGSDGSMLVTREGSQHFPACKVKAVDPTAAGDAFTAALTVRLAAGAPLHQAMRFANRAGALATTKLGAQPSLPTRKEVEAFMAGESAP